MNGGRLGTVFATVLTFLAATYVAVSVLLDRGNTVGSFFFYAMVGGGIVGAIAPRLSFSFLLAELALLDGVKRMMVFAGNVEQIDLFWVLGIAPVTLAGIFTGVVIRMLLGQIPAEQGDVQRLLAVAALNVLFVGISLIKGNGIGGTLREVANGSFYSVLLFLVPVLFRTTADAVGVLRLTIFIFIPVALYGVYQLAYGFQEYEIDYLKQGLSIEMKQLEADRVRAFSTLNSPTALGSVTGLLSGFCLVMAWYRSRSGRSVLTPFVAILCGLIFFAGMVSSTSRSDFAAIPVIALSAWAFPSASRTRFIYAIAVGSFLTLIFSSTWLLSRLDEFNRMIAGNYAQGSFIALMSAVGSYSDRLVGFSTVLINPAAWSLLGIDSGTGESGYRVHDPLSELLLHYGAVGIIMVILFAIVALRLMHRQLLHIQDPWGKRLSATMLGMVFSLVLVSLVSGTRFTVFPINTFVSMLAGIHLVIVQHESRIRRALAQQEHSEDEASLETVETTLAHPPVGTGRFGPVVRA